VSSQFSRATSIFLDLFQLSPKGPDLKLLGEVSLHFAKLPWENLTKFIKKHRHVAESGDGQRRLSLEVMADHARLGTGGTCFSLANALRRITSDLGYRVHPVMADMKHGPNVHCAVLIEMDGGRYLLDPGYLVAEPVPLYPGREACVRFPGHRLEYRPVEGSDEIELYTTPDRGEEIFRYRLRPRRIPEPDFIRYWLESFDAAGMNGLHLNRITSEGRLSAHDLNLRIDTGRAKRNVKLRGTYAKQISHRFGIDGDLVRRAFGEWEQRRCRRSLGRRRREK
jgi:arylamine N-acetyltransferase